MASSETLAIRWIMGPGEPIVVCRLAGWGVLFEAALSSVAMPKQVEARLRQYAAALGIGTHAMPLIDSMDLGRSNEPPARSPGTRASPEYDPGPDAPQLAFAWALVEHICIWALLP
jgi:hypothetical protein